MLKISNKPVKVSFLSLLVIVSFVLVACTPGAATSQPTDTLVQTMESTMAPAMASATPTAAGVSTPTAPAAIMSTLNSSLGTILVDSNGMTLYYFLKDSMNTSACTGTCPVTWPPFLTNGTPTTTDPAVTGTLGFITRDDGSQQVTYNGMPLYYNVVDKAAGDVTGQGYKNLWYVVPAAGVPTSTPSVAATSTTAPVTGATDTPYVKPTY